MTPVAAASRFLMSCPPGAVLLVAISGGSDSTGLLLALCQAAKQSGRDDIKLHAATIDHDLRSGSSDEALAVSRLCASLNIPHSIAVWTGAKPKTGIPAAARIARYQLLSKIAAGIDATCVVTGHTLNDQHETIQMRAGRSKPDAPGLSGMAPAMLFERHTWVVRPFLDVSRQAIRDDLTKAGLAWVDDPTNENTQYERARVRKTLEAEPVPESILTRANGRASDATEIAGLLQKTCEVVSQSVAVIRRTAIAGHPQGLKALAYLVAVMGGRSHLPSGDALARLVPYLSGARDGTLSLGRTVVTFRKDCIFVCRESRDLPQMVIPPSQSGFWDGRFRIENLTGQPVTISGDVCVTGTMIPDLADLPPFVANRAAKAMPCLHATSDSAPSGASEILSSHRSDIKVDVIFPLFDLFLPIFDLPVANCISVLFERPIFSPFPLHYI